jgi:ligand-binding sensor domain-containing protein
MPRRSWRAKIIISGRHRGAGLYHLNPNGTLIRHYSQRDGLVNDTVFNISADERGLLWIATNDGISMFNPETGNFRNFDVNDGLPGNSFDALVTGPSSNGPIYFGGKDGLVMFSPEEIRDNPIVPPVVLTDFELNNKPAPIGDESVLKRSIIETRDLTLSYEDRVLTFEFAALSFVAPEKNRYRYKLEGFDTDWIEVGSDRRRVTYTNLDPGEYTFALWFKQRRGLNEQGASLTLSSPPGRNDMVSCRAGNPRLRSHCGWLRGNDAMRCPAAQLEFLVAGRTASLAYTKDQEYAVQHLAAGH